MFNTQLNIRMTTRISKIPLLVASLVFIQPLTSVAHAKVATPPQYVVLAFDGSKTLSMWEDTIAYAKQMTEVEGKPLKFTYFVNAAYFLNQKPEVANQYHGPGVRAGVSAIGFGGTLGDVIERFKYMNLAKTEHNEIANHAAGHFDGSKWSQDEWHSEFNQFYDILFNVFNFNFVDAGTKAQLEKQWTFTQADMIGFRAPLLGQNKAMYAELPKWGIKYDTSLTSAPNRWPAKNMQGLWSFPLASIKIAGTNKSTLSMDYNFYYAQSGAKPDLARAKDFEDQMYYSYVNYFYDNYNGNRAPVNIGHHFAQWNGGAYWRAMRRFAEQVCGLPDVKCVTYKELLDFMNSDRATPDLVKAYQAGDFDHTAEPRPRMGRGMIMPPIMKGIDLTQLMISDPPEAHDEE